MQTQITPSRSPLWPSFTHLVVAIRGGDILGA
jgi:hypothetical protein